MMKNEYATIIRSIKNHGAGQVNHQHRQQSRIHGAKLCIWWDQLDVVYYEILQSNETITGERYQ